MLKKEVRILGLSATTRKKNRTLIIGVVFRGCSWLDGILTCSLELSRHDHISRISRAIKNSRQYPQLHAVILSREQTILGLDIHIADLARELKLPVILIAGKRRETMKKGKEPIKTNCYELTINGKHLSVVTSRIGPERAQEIFNVACTSDYPIPEAARVADLIAEQVTLKWNSLGLA